MGKLFWQAGEKIILAGGKIILEGGKIISDGGKIISEGGKIILACGKIILVGQVGKLFCRWENYFFGISCHHPTIPSSPSRQSAQIPQ